MKIKICGIRNLEDAHCVEQAGADYLGFIFYAPSKRYIHPVEAGKISRSLGPGIKKVGVFVNESAETIKSVAAIAELDIIQLHGHESSQIIAELAPLNCIKAVSDIATANAFPGLQLLVDVISPEYGGTGEKSDWQFAATLTQDREVFLAGGLDCDNILEAINIVRPYAVDVSSGVELSKGLKDHTKVKRFVSLIRSFTE